MDGAVATLALPGLAPRQEFRAHTKYASKVAFSASGNWLLSAGYDWKLVCYWRDSHTGDYSIAHSLTFLGAVESLVCLPGTESFVVGSRNDSNLHVIDMPRDNAPSKEPTRQRCSMNKNGDDWISFTPMDMSVVANDSTPSVSGSVTSWTLAVYTDLPSGKICLYNLALPQLTEFKTTTPPTTAEAAAAAEPLASLSISSTSVSSPFVLSWIGDCFGVVADSFSRPRCLLLPLGKHLILAATSDDSKIMLYDAISVLMNEEGVAKKLGEISGHEGIIRALCFEQEPQVDGGKSAVSLYSGSFDSTIRKWRIES
ncbi:WD40-repeat-containing domain protein [Obelidium mucronatum]|nr:WD40-repeat-containing domain protein [Obelidium mucronatum]